MLPQSEVRLECVAKFIVTNREEIKDIKKLAQLVFGKSSSLSVEEGIEKLEKIIGYYSDFLQASKSAVCEEKGL